MEKKSINSLKQWISRIKRYEIKLPNLYEKLEYLKVKSLGYNSPSFSPRISSNGSSIYLGIDYWLELIDDCEREIEAFENELTRYYDFINELNEVQTSIFKDYYYYNIKTNIIVKKNNIKRYEIYNVFKSIDNLYKINLEKNTEIK